MNRLNAEWWELFQKHYGMFPGAGLALDEPRFKRAFTEMAELEVGAIANVDEKPMVGHYWLRAPNLAPNDSIRAGIVIAVRQEKQFAAEVHANGIRGAGSSFKSYLLIGIGCSALGPQFLVHALGDADQDRIKPHFLDNTDSDGICRVLTDLRSELDRTLCIVISKSGGKETRNGIIEANGKYDRAGI